MNEEPKFASYDEAQKYQLDEWVAGRPWHNPWSPGATAAIYGSRIEGECCPDFSCCVPENIWARERRLTFAEANDETKYNMLLGSLSGLVAGHNVHVAGVDNPDDVS